MESDLTEHDSRAINEELTPHLIIAPSSGWKLINWKELVAYHALFWLLALRDGPRPSNPPGL